MFLSNLNGFNSSPSLPVQGFARRKGSSKVWKEKSSKWFYHFSLSLLVFVCALLICSVFMFWVSLVFMLCLFNMFLFGYFSVFALFLFVFIKIKIKIKIWKIRKIQKQCVFCTLVLMYLGWPLKQSLLNFVSICSLDEHLYAQLSKWALWLMFVMSTIKLSLKLNMHITLFDGKD